MPGVEPTEWVYVTQRTLWADDSFCVEEAVAVTADGLSLGSARQLRRILAVAAG
ncbi:hypothetical protein [Streptomyces mirabilis]|uniref:hypothetical protein n=1 Tax=Streptomyces mirabilis TaxID=68239 RepID=UPI0033AC8E6C